MGQKVSLMDTLLQMRMTAKTLERESKKREKAEAAQKKMVAQRVKQGDMESAKIYAENAIREKKQALQYLQMASRVQTVASRIEAMQKMNRVSRSLGKVTRDMNKVMKTMDIEKISGVMEKFESQMEDMDVRTGVMEGAMARGTASVTPAEEIEAYLAQAAEEAGLEAAGDLAGAGAVPSGVGQTSGPTAVTAEEKLAARLNAMGQ